MPAIRHFLLSSKELLGGRAPVNGNIVTVVFPDLDPVNQLEENIDFFVFSAHKMYSPYGGGAVIGLGSVLNEHMPAFYGGGTVQIVGDYSVSYKDAPDSYEAGSPNYPGVSGRDHFKPLKTPRFRGLFIFSES